MKFTERIRRSAFVQQRATGELLAGIDTLEERVAALEDERRSGP